MPRSYTLTVALITVMCCYYYYYYYGVKNQRLKTQVYCGCCCYYYDWCWYT